MRPRFQKNAARFTQMSELSYYENSSFPVKPAECFYSFQLFNCGLDEVFSVVAFPS